MENPFDPTSEDRTPFWQCEKCGEIMDDEILEYRPAAIALAEKGE